MAREIFADTHYWVALANPRDQWRAAARAVQRAPLDRIVTTDEVLVEFLGFVSGMGQEQRSGAARICRQLFLAHDVDVVHQSRSSFLAGLSLFEARQDKGYSLVDCVSMVTMREMGIREVLTADRHFEQEGFVPLLRR